ncbi:MAG: diguanylate cyclase [Verrucomicrobia bacterium]|jgi:two-component system, cell cycle response regulator|nr:diguanylate cyclase [Verrucomicrobiota bacterium]
MRITKRVFHDLAIWMVCFGLSIGVVFPFFVTGLGVPSEIAFTRVFFAACLSAGAIAGIINFVLARWIVGDRICLLASGMRRVENKLKQMAAADGDVSGCTPEECAIVVDSEDEIGDSARAFNHLVGTLAFAMETEQAFRAFTKMLSSNLDLKTLSENALKMFLEHSGATGGAVLYESEGELKVAASLGVRAPEELLTNNHILAAVKSGESSTISIPEGILLEGVLASFTPKEVCILPANYKSVPLGIVVLGTSTSFSPEHLTRMELFRNGLGLALNNVFTHDSLKRLAALDPLTGAYNRRFGLGRLQEEFSRAVRASSPLGVMMLDLDHFKSVNDTYGHMVGDRVLKSVVGCVRSILREGDILLRYGGEEFMAIFPAASSADLRDMGERIRRRVEETSLLVGDQTISVTVSLGGASFPDNNFDSVEKLVELSDKALYRAKENGRNRTEVAVG